jgi:hypothetical protein
MPAQPMKFTALSPDARQTVCLQEAEKSLNRRSDSLSRVWQNCSGRLVVISTILYLIIELESPISYGLKSSMRFALAPALAANREMVTQMWRTVV